MTASEEKLSKLASELTERVALLEKENESLRSMPKQAAVQAPAAPVVTEKTVSQTCDVLVRIGAIQQEQVEFTKQAFMKDPETAHRVILGLAEQQLAKSAADSGSLNGGYLVDAPTSGTAEDACLDRIQHILGMY